MKKRFLQIAATALAIALGGCGGGGSVPSGNNNSNTNSPNTDTNIIDVREIENPRISIAGSSVTWGSGGKIDDDSYPGYVVDALRKNYAVTILPDKLNSNVVPVPYGGTEPYTYGRSLYKFSGKGVELSGTISGKKLYIVLARERDNTHAALVDVYIDNELVKTFSTKNDTPYFRNKQFSAVADGEQRSWDLGSAHTFNHIVRLNGNVNEKGKINDLGYDAKWPVGYDWLIFRKVTGNEVHHFISFQDPPAQGTKIDVAYDSGENIKPVKSTSDNTEKFLGTKIESLYGDRTTKDLTQPLHFEEGVDFRETDDRAVEVVDMGNDTAHSFRLVVKSVDPVAKDSTPELYLNYITNRMFYIQNASIGGFTAKDFLKTTGTTNIDNINAFNPDLVILESATNDDWDDNEWLAWKDVYMSADEVRNKITSAINLQKLQKTGDKYKVGITHINIKSYTSKSVTLDPDATYSNDIKDGDILVIGDFKGDNRRLAVRLISRWDNKTKTAYFNKDLHTEDFVGNVCQIKRIDKWVENVKEFVRRAREYNSNVEIGIITGGMPNMNARRLEGYREKALSFIDDLQAKYIDIYQATYDFTYNREPKKQLFLNANKSVTSTGAKRYTLYLDNGNPLEVMLARNFKVFVDGKQLTIRDFYVDGGLVKTWPQDVGEPLDLYNAKWVVKPSILVFEDGIIPEAGKDIKVFYNDNDDFKWSQDDTHLGTNGYKIYSQTIINTLFK